jgi:hypothetical protein
VTRIAEIDFRNISSYHSQGNGAVERRNRDVSSILKKLCSKDFFRWNQVLPWVAYFLNIAISSRTKTSPFVLMFGRRPVGLQDYVLSTYKLPSDMKEWLENWKRLEEVIYPAIAERVTIEQARAAQAFEKDHKITEEIQPGSLVMIRDVTRQSKWSEYYSGPFEVIRRNTGGAYLLKDSLGQQLPFRIPINHIKRAPHAKQLSEGHFVVKKILSHRMLEDKTEYLVRWEGKEIPDSWVLSEYFDGGSMVDNYVRKHKLIPSQVVEDTTTTAGVAIAESVPNQVVEDTTTTAGEVIASSFPSQVVEDTTTTAGEVIASSGILAIIADK